VKESVRESEEMEFKLSLTEWRDIVETVSAFSNTKGGTIKIGVADDREVIGVTVGKNTIEKLANQIKQNTDPSVFPSIVTEEKDGKEVIVIHVKEGEAKPIFAFGRAFKRVGKTNQRLGYEEIRRLSIQTSKVYWDGQICKEATLDDIDDAKVTWFLRKAKFERNFDVEPETPGEEALERLKLIKGGKLTNASILLFGENPSRFFMQAETRCARFKGTKPLEFIDMKVFGGTIINQREDAVAFVKEHIKLHAKIIDTERVETWEYPIEAVREAITNAICHRDYEIASNVQIRIFDDRIEIWGVGPLPEPVTVKDLRKKHDSVLRNPLLGEALFLIKFIEQWGTGTNRIIEECLNHGLPEPLFEEITDSLVLTFRKYRITEDALDELNERQQKVVNYLIKHGKITNKEYRRLNPNVTDRTALNDFNELIRKSILLAKGEKKYRYYVLR